VKLELVEERETESAQRSRPGAQGTNFCNIQPMGQHEDRDCPRRSSYIEAFLLPSSDRNYTGQLNMH
jgi:hypothetical protein